LVDLIIQLSGVLIAGAVLLSLVRLVKGPTLIDRIVALDVLTIVAIVLIVIYAHMADRSAYLDVALTYGLLSFMSVLAVARYVERGL
jgi:multicomponent Na+:H+ antiporter subunit F